MHLTNCFSLKFTQLFIVALCINVSLPGFAETKRHPSAVKGNTFAHNLVKLSNQLINKQSIISKTSFGGYGGITNDLKFYKQTMHINKAENNVTSIVQWETKNPENLHDVVVNIYDNHGQLLRDYSASYLPIHRNAPIQTLINLHYHEKQIHSFRQFDALDNILYEQCQGTYNNKPVAISMDYLDIPDSPNEIEDVELRHAYHACFDKISSTAEPYTNPLVELKK